MRIRALKLAIVSACFLLPLTADGAKVREPAVAGSFYPADPKTLAATLDGYLSRADAGAAPEPVRALVAPHAGYPYSGPVAAYAYARLRGRKITRVIVIAPSHYEGFPFVAAYDGDVYRTPLGDVRVDQEFIRRLARATPVVRLSDRGHTPVARGGEHALEVQLPFLQRVLGDFKLVPLIMGDQDYETERALGLALAKLIEGPETLIVASSDLSHFHPQPEAERMDRLLLKATGELHHREVAENLERRSWEACGGGPIVATMVAAEKLGASRANVLKYATSAEAGGDKSRVVGYAAIEFTKPAPAAANDPYSLSAQDRATLLDIARQSVRMAVTQGKRFQPAAPASTALREQRGAFVTLKKRGELRGCIGMIIAQQPLYLTVRDVAAYAAQEDPRFPPVSAAELDRLEFEVSVLSPMRRIADPREVRVGEHGVMVKRGFHQGLLLPQVAVEQKWDRHTLLDQCCYKAGLEDDAWQDRRTEIFVFTALVFSDAEQQRSR